jgi:hypothetical protein
MPLALLFLQGEAVPRLTLLLPSAFNRAAARDAVKAWESFDGRKEIVLVVTDFEALERDLIQWLDVVPRGVVLRSDLELLRRHDVRRLPCFLYFDGRKTHRTYGIPKEVTSCSR